MPYSADYFLYFCIFLCVSLLRLSAYSGDDGGATESGGGTRGEVGGDGGDDGGGGGGGGGGSGGGGGRSGGGGGAGLRGGGGQRRQTPGHALAHVHPPGSHQLLGLLHSTGGVFYFPIFFLR